MHHAYFQRFGREYDRARTMYSILILTSISTSSGLYLYNVPLHSSCDSYKEKCHKTTLKIMVKIYLFQPIVNISDLYNINKNGILRILNTFTSLIQT